MRPDLRDLRLALLTLAMLLLVASFVAPKSAVRRPTFDLLAVVDITGSMNVRDYSASGRPLSRLDAVKSALRAMLAEMPCPSHVGLGVFSERKEKGVESKIDKKMEQYYKDLYKSDE